MTNLSRFIFIFLIIISISDFDIKAKEYTFSKKYKKPNIMKNQKNISDKGIVVLLHGLVRTDISMKKIARNLKKQNYTVINIKYPSRKGNLQFLGKNVSNQIIQELIKNEIIQTHPTKNKKITKKIIKKSSLNNVKLNFVTHSMGGIIVREIISKKVFPNVGRVIMMTPPNKGTELIDLVNNKLTLFKKILGPAALQLGTDSYSYVNQLGNVNFDLGIIAGGKSFNFLFSAFIKGKDDGAVSIQNTKVKGMKHFKIMPYGHSFIMYKQKVINEILTYLSEGKFRESS